MRRVLWVLLTLALCAPIVGVSLGCGATHVKPSVKASDYGFASSGMAERIVALRNFMLNSGKTSDITLAVFGYELRIVAEMKGNLPPHGIVPSLHCTLYRLTTAGPLAVPLPSGPELPGAPQEPPFWTCTFHTESPLRSGLYRLSLSGQGRLVYFGVAQM